MKSRPTEMHTAEVIEVIRVITAEGAGTDNDVVRTVYYYFLKDGTLIAKVDPIEDRTNNKGI